MSDLSVIVNRLEELLQKAQSEEGLSRTEIRELGDIVYGITKAINEILDALADAARPIIEALAIWYDKLPEDIKKQLVYSPPVVPTIDNVDEAQLKVVLSDRLFEMPVDVVNASVYQKIHQQAAYQ